MNGLDLFSGIGGISLALSEWVKTIAYCESDRYAQSVLISRMLAGELDRAPIWDDVRSLTGKHLPDVDIIFGGFPCQDISVAGRGAGLEGERSGLFFEIVRLTKEIRPTFVFLENVPAIRTRGLREVVRAFTDLRYDCRWTCVSAAEVGAPHLRKRWFLLAHSSGERRQQVAGGAHANESKYAGRPAEEMHIAQCNGKGSGKRNVANSAGIGRESRRPERKLGPDQCNMANTERVGLEESGQTKNRSTNSIANSSWWSAEPNVGRVVNGLPMRVDRIKCLGNSVVPEQVKEAFMRLAGIK